MCAIVLIAAIDQNNGAHADFENGQIQSLIHQLQQRNKLLRCVWGRMIAEINIFEIEFWKEIFEIKILNSKFWKYTDIGNGDIRSMINNLQMLRVGNTILTLAKLKSEFVDDSQVIICRYIYRCVYTYWFRYVYVFVYKYVILERWFVGESGFTRCLQICRGTYIYICIYVYRYD